MELCANTSALNNHLDKIDKADKLYDNRTHTAEVFGWINLSNSKDNETVDFTGSFDFYNDNVYFELNITDELTPYIDQMIPLIESKIYCMLDGDVWDTDMDGDLVYDGQEFADIEIDI